MATGLDEARAALRARQGSGARYDAANAPARDLDWARQGTAYFARLLNGMTDAELDGASRLPGISRRHIVAQIGYHARLLSDVIAWVRAGDEGRLPFKAEVDAENVRRQMTQPARALRNLFDHAAVHLNVEWRDLTDAQWDARVEDQDGQIVIIRETPWRRARALWLHAIDLGVGGRFADMSDEFARALIEDAAGRSVDGRAAPVARWLYGRGDEPPQSPGGDLPHEAVQRPHLIGF